MSFFEALKNVVGPDFILMVAVIVLAYLYACWRITGKKQEVELKNLQVALDQMEEQTRLIIKTDLELSQMQEENDRQLMSFKSLQSITHKLSSLLEEDKVYESLSESLIVHLGFKFFMLFLCTGDEIIEKRCIGFDDKSKRNAFLESIKSTGFSEYLSEHRIIASSSMTTLPDYVKTFLEEDVGLSSYSICALKSKGEMLGGVICGNFKSVSSLEGVREITEVFVTQLAQALDNIRMFEKIYKSQQELEFRVKERTNDLQKAMVDLESANKRKTEFVSAVSHEFRTPLTSIKGYAALLAGGKFGDLPDGIKTRLGRINDQADALVGMINDLLDIARIESGRVQISLQRLDLVDLLKAEAEMFLPQLSEKNISIDVDVPEKAEADVDKQLMSRVFINLISNAIKFTPEGKKINVSLSEEEKNYRLSVHDEGIGIPAADLENVFKEFFRVDTAEHRGIKGTGLGLSLVVNIVRAHKGQIWVESDTGKGANFIFLLPKNLTLEAGAEIAI